MATICSGCGAEVPYRCTSSVVEAARCPSCGALTDLRAAKSMAVKSQAPLPVPIPVGWQVSQPGGSLRIRWRWFKSIALFLIPFAAFWNGILGMMAFGVTDQFRHPERLLFGLLVPHVWVGIGLIYAILAMLLNTTTVEASPRMVVVHHGPLPWRGNRRLHAEDLVQAFVVEQTRRNRGNGIGTGMFQVCGIDRQGKRIVLVSGLDSPDQAKFLEQQIENQLGIEDRPVEGEVARYVV